MIETFQQRLSHTDWTNLPQPTAGFKPDELSELIQAARTSHPKTPRQLRAKLAQDVYTTTAGPTRLPQTLELPFSEELLYAFSDGIAIPDWCEAVGISVTINPNPAPEFRSKTTLIFKDIRHEPTAYLDDSEDEEL